jgi:hypothetical protein
MLRGIPELESHRSGHGGWLNLAQVSGPIYRVRSSYPGVDPQFSFLSPHESPFWIISDSPGLCRVESKVLFLFTLPSVPRPALITHHHV